MWCGAGGYVFGSASMYANFFGAFLQAAPAGTAILSLACAANHRARHVARDVAPYIYTYIYTYMYTYIYTYTYTCDTGHPGGHVSWTHAT